jgi:hypothetical protein
MTTEAAELVQDGPIADARTGVTDLEAMAQADPAQVMADQSAAIAQAAGDMQALQEAAELALTQARSGTVGTLGTVSTEITGSEEQQRAEAGRRMQAIFDRARTDVDGLLQPLSGAALARWDAGVDRLAGDFESSLASVKQRIDERYRTEDDWDPFDEIASGVTQAWDYVAGLPDWVVEEYDRAEQLFADGCTTLITDISRDVNAVIEDCQAIIQQARDDIDEIVTSLPEELQAWAQGEAARLGTELDALESQVTETQQTLNQDLIDRSNAAVQEVRERVHELREAAKGVVGRIADAVAAFLDDPARFIIDGLLRVLGIPPANFWALVDQLGNVIDGIAADPMGFANNLMAGVGQGFQQFFGNFPLHMGQGLFAWLFSKMSEAGVTMPRDFSIPSIVSLVLDIMGINWQRIRMLLARHIGEQNVAHIEQAYDIITTFVARGPLGLVELMREQLDPASIVDMIRETAIRYLMESIVTRVAARILMMLNPAGAILQAIEAIYRVLTWIYENAARIFTLIEAVVNGAAQVLAGNVGGLAGLVEHALVGLMVPVIDFLADYLGLGGIPAAIRDLVMGLQARIERILDRVIGFIAEKARTLLGAMGMGGQPGQPGGDDVLGKEVRFQAEGESHRVWVQQSGTEPTLMVASTPMSVEDRLSDWTTQLDQLSDARDAAGVVPRQRARSLIARARQLHASADREADRLARQTAPRQGSAQASSGYDDDALEQQETSLADVLRQLFEVFGDETGANRTEVLEQAVIEIKGRLDGEGGRLSQLADSRAVVATMKGIYQRESDWLEEKTKTLPGDKPTLRLIPRADASSYWIDVKINPEIVTTRWAKGTGGHGRSGASEFTGMFHGSPNRLPDVVNLDINRLRGKRGDGSGLELGSGLYLSYYFRDVRGYVPRQKTHGQDGWFHRFWVPQTLLRNASQADPDTSGDAAFPSGDVLKGQWLHIHDWKAGYQWVIKTEAAIQQLQLDDALPPYPAADQWGRGRQKEFPEDFGGGPESLDSARRLSGSGGNALEAGEPQRVGAVSSYRGQRDRKKRR